MTLFEIYNEYRCGNKDIFNTIAADRVILGEYKSYGQSNFELISPLKELSRKLYERYPQILRRRLFNVILRVVTSAPVGGSNKSGPYLHLPDLSLVRASILSGAKGRI